MTLPGLVTGGNTRNFVTGPRDPKGLKTRKNVKITRDVHSSGAPWGTHDPLWASHWPLMRP